jgi:hypothetical protein
MAKVRYEPEGIYVGRDLYPWDTLLKEFQKRVQIDPKAKIEVLPDVCNALERAVYDSDMKRNRWGLWSGLKAALEYLQTDLVPVYVILDGARRNNLTYIEVEFAGGTIVKGEPDLNPYVGRGALWRLGPFLASSGEPGPQAVPEPLARPAQSARKDGAFEDSGPTAPSETALKLAQELAQGCSNWHDIQHTLIPRIAKLIDSHAQARLKPEPYRGPINIPCSSCGDGDTAMEYHTHDWAPLENRVDRITFHGGQDR